MAIVATLQAYGVINAQHRFEHALQFPGVAYAETVAEAHGHDHHDDGGVADDHHADETTVDTPEVGGDDRPINHHHHANADLHLALASTSRPVDGAPVAATRLGPAPDALPPGATGDGPTHPPKQTQLIA